MIYHEINRINIHSDSWLQVLLQNQIESLDWNQELGRQGEKRNPRNW